MNKHDAYVRALKNLAREQLSAILDAELDKSEDEMDIDLIEHCLDLIEQLDVKKPYSEQPKVIIPKRRVFAKRVLLAAAVLVLVLSLCFAALAVTGRFHVVSELVEFYSDHIRIRFDKSEEKAEEYMLLGSELAQELSSHGISPVLLPEVLLTDSVIKEIRYQEENKEFFIDAIVDFQYGLQKGYLVINHFINKDLMPAPDIAKGATLVEQIKIAGVTVYIIQQTEGEFAIVYQDNFTQYHIQLSANVEVVIAFAKTIK